MSVFRSIISATVDVCSNKLTSDYCDGLSLMYVYTCDLLKQNFSRTKKLIL